MDILLFCSIAILSGFLSGKILNRLKLPGVVGYLLIGFVLGPSFINLFSLKDLSLLGGFNEMALSVVAFIIGSQLHLSILKKVGKGIFAVILWESFAAFSIVALGIYWLTKSLPLALLFGAMAPASAPAGTVVVLRESKAKGPLTNTLYTVVGLDDGLAIIIYAFAAAFARLSLTGSSQSVISVIRGPIIEIIGSLFLGIVLGFAFSYFARKIRSKRELLAVSLGFVFLCTGIGNYFGFSLILSNLVLGMVSANTFILTNRRIIDTVDSITVPIYIIFFVIAGAHLQLKFLPHMGFLGLVYIVCRITGLISGSFIGATIAKLPMSVRKYLGLGILSQAGVAIGLAMLVSKDFSDLGIAGNRIASLIVNTIAATTLVFEIIGPITTKFAIWRAGEINQQVRQSKYTE
jgi:Kef-type K+ transport system membrane component KefB